MAAQRGSVSRVVRLFVVPILVICTASSLIYTFVGIPEAESVLKLIPAISKPAPSPPLPPLPDVKVDNPAGAPLHPTSRPAPTSNTSLATPSTVDTRPRPPKYKPTPTWTPPPQRDPFPLLASSDGPPPPIPAYNVPRPNLHRDYGLAQQPLLFIGFTRQWTMLLQAVVSYITAGWPPESIVVVENTGVQGANARGELSLQNPFYLNHTTMRRLGVEVLQTPVLLSFAQLQNFFLATARERARGYESPATNTSKAPASKTPPGPYYFYSHQDILVFSLEDGADDTHRPADRDWEFYDDRDRNETMNPPAARQPGYLTMYERAIRELNRTLEADPRWGFRWFQYDHLTLVNGAALDAVGGWDSLIGYYLTDCDLKSRLEMEGWSMIHRRIGIINDVASTLEDLAALYRVPGAAMGFVDPNPAMPEETPLPTPELSEADDVQEEKHHVARSRMPTNQTQSLGEPKAAPSDNQTARAYFRKLVETGNAMGEHKYGERGRNTWQGTQHGGFGEPYYYDAAGFAKALDILTEAGREVYRQKWGERECDFLGDTALKLWDQWRVERNWED